jgi:16S rRNA (adenine1518-N6/adenine1519-N6)-dimethyltransferase
MTRPVSRRSPSRPPPRSRGERSTRTDREIAPKHRPRKRFGQHFLVPSWAGRVVSAIGPEAGDVFLEIGPGTGALTLPLAATGVPVLGVELDRDLVADLAQRAPSNVTVLSGDFLTTDVMPFLSGLEPQRVVQDVGGARGQRRFRVAGNLPYYIASPILFRLIELHRQTGAFFDATVMLQREVADRLLARPKSKDYGVLTILVGLHAKVTRLLDLPPGAFSPPPAVRSSVVRLAFGPPAGRVADEQAFERMVKALFGGRRKTLANALKRFDPTASAVLALAGIDSRRRPDTLDIAELVRLADLFASVNRPSVV